MEQIDRLSKQTCSTFVSVLEEGISLGQEQAKVRLRLIHRIRTWQNSTHHDPKGRWEQWRQIVRRYRSELGGS